MTKEQKIRARERALRAARVVTIAAALMGGVACSSSRGGGVPTDAPIDTRRADTSMGDVVEPDIADRDVDRDQQPTDRPGPDLRDAIADLSPDVQPDVQSDVPPDMECPPFGGGGNGCCEPISRECCDGRGSWDEASNCCLTCAIGPLVPPAMIG